MLIYKDLRMGRGLGPHLKRTLIRGSSKDKLASGASAN
jgi:hypothetical protein